MIVERPAFAVPVLPLWPWHSMSAPLAFLLLGWIARGADRWRRERNCKADQTFRMDLNTITEIARPQHDTRCRPGVRVMPGSPAAPGCSPSRSPRLSRLIDLAGLGWPPLSRRRGRAARSPRPARSPTLAALALPPDWAAAPLFGQCCRAFLGSFKIWNMATVGGNLCMALPAGPMISLCRRARRRLHHLDAGRRRAPRRRRSTSSSARSAPRCGRANCCARSSCRRRR